MLTMSKTGLSSMMMDVSDSMRVYTLLKTPPCMSADDEKTNYYLYY